jgi:hypothetical protein
MNTCREALPAGSQLATSAMAAELAATKRKSDNSIFTGK